VAAASGAIGLTSSCECPTLGAPDYRSPPPLSRSSYMCVVSLLICSLNESEFACTPLADARSRPRPRPGKLPHFWSAPKYFRLKSTSAIAQECVPAIFEGVVSPMHFGWDRYICAGGLDVLRRLDFALDEISPPRIKNNALDYPPVALVRPTFSCIAAVE